MYHSGRRKLKLQLRPKQHKTQSLLSLSLSLLLAFYCRPISVSHVDCNIHINKTLIHNHITAPSHQPLLHTHVPQITTSGYCTRPITHGDYFIGIAQYGDYFMCIAQYGEGSGVNIQYTHAMGLHNTSPYHGALPLPLPVVTVGAVDLKCLKWTRISY